MKNSSDKNVSSWPEGCDRLAEVFIDGNDGDPVAAAHLTCLMFRDSPNVFSDLNDRWGSIGFKAKFRSLYYGIMLSIFKKCPKQSGLKFNGWIARNNFALDQ